MTTVDAKSFHPMTGHVAIDTVVIFSDGTRGSLSNDMSGWSLNLPGKKVSCGHNANAVARAVFEHDDGCK